MVHCPLRHLFTRHHDKKRRFDSIATSLFGHNVRTVTAHLFYSTKKKSIYTRTTVCTQSNSVLARSYHLMVVAIFPLTPVGNALVVVRLY